MNRLVIPRRTTTRTIGASESTSSGDDLTTRLIKNIPGEIISGYMVLSGLLAAAPETSPLKWPVGIALVVLGIALTPVYLYKVGGKPSREQWLQFPIATMSFFLWAYALGWPFTMLTFFGYEYESWFAMLLAGAFAWVVAIAWRPKTKEAPVTPPAVTSNPTA